MQSLSLYIICAFGFSIYKVKTSREFEHKVLLGKKTEIYSARDSYCELILANAVFLK